MEDQDQLMHLYKALGVRREAEISDAFGLKGELNAKVTLALGNFNHSSQKIEPCAPLGERL